MSGYVAKSACSAVYVSKRKPDDVKKEEFSFPFSLVSFRVDDRDSSVSASVIGLARKKAIYRKGLGATLLNGISEEELRRQAIALPAAPGYSQDSLAWPLGDIIADTPMTRIDKSRLDSAVNTAFYDPLNKKDRGTRAVIVVYKGQIIAERYAPGFSAQTPLLGWSMTKSITNALIGILVRQRQLDIRSPVSIPGWQHDERRRITYTQLMQMTSGLQFHWFLAGPGDLTNMLFKEKDMAVFAESLPLKFVPGTLFHYSDGNANILSRLIRDRLGDREYYRFPYEQLFYKTGMLHTLLEPDASGTFVGSSFCYGTARDWARFGLLYLNDGVCNGERLLPEGWVSWTSRPSGVPNNENGNGEYGALWWVNAGRDGHEDWRRFHHVPSDCFSCQGYDGQFVLVIPSKQLVVVRLSLEKDYLDPGNFAADIIAAIKR